MKEEVDYDTSCKSYPRLSWACLTLPNFACSGPGLCDWFHVLKMTQNCSCDDFPSSSSVVCFLLAHSAFCKEKGPQNDPKTGFLNVFEKFS